MSKIFAVRRVVLASIIGLAAFAAGAAVYVVYGTEREYQRLIGDGDRAAAAGEGFQALEAYSGAIALRPDSMVAHLKRGLTYEERGELDAAFKDLRRAVELDPTATRPLELLGDVQMSLGRYERAAERYDAYLALDDSSPRVFYKLGLARYRAGDLSSAADPLQKAVRLDKSFAAAHLLLGLCLRDRQDLRGARGALEAASALDPSLTAPREALAALYTGLGETTRAIDQLEALVALDPTRPARLVALGRAYANAGRHEAAVLTLGRAVERFPDSSTAYAALGRVWLEAAETRRDTVALRKAVEALSTAASHTDVSSDALTDLGRAWLLMGDTASAERALRQATATLPVPPEAFLHLATISERAGRVQQARDSLVQYATLIGDHRLLVSVATRIADYSLTLGEPRLAMRWLDRAIDRAGASAALLARLADASWRAGDYQRASEAVDAGLKLDANEPSLVALRRRLQTPH
jgi:tetratricopeptide (TPR) repeat protein